MFPYVIFFLLKSLCYQWLFVSLQTSSPHTNLISLIFEVRNLFLRPQYSTIVTKEHVYRTKICCGLDFIILILANTRGNGICFLSRLVYKSNFLCKFEPSVLAKPLNNAQIVRGVFCLCNDKKITWYFRMFWWTPYVDICASRGF